MNDQVMSILAKHLNTILDPIANEVAAILVNAQAAFDGEIARLTTEQNQHLANVRADLDAASAQAADLKAQLRDAIKGREAAEKDRDAVRAKYDPQIQADKDAADRKKLADMKAWVASEDARLNPKK